MQLSVLPNIPPTLGTMMKPSNFTGRKTKATQKGTNYLSNSILSKNQPENLVFQNVYNL
jgi:hypothetical protein